MLKYLLIYVQPQSPETQHGATLALGYMVGRYMSKKKALNSGETTHNMEMSITSQDDELVAMATKTIGIYTSFQSFPLMKA